MPCKALIICACMIGAHIEEGGGYGVGGAGGEFCCDAIGTCLIPPCACLLTGETMTVTCADNFKAKGDLTVTCQSDGTWSWTGQCIKCGWSLVIIQLGLWCEAVSNITAMHSHVMQRPHLVCHAPLPLCGKYALLIPANQSTWLPLANLCSLRCFSSCCRHPQLCSPRWHDWN